MLRRNLNKSEKPTQKKRKNMITIRISKKFRNIDANLNRIKRLIRDICARFELTNAIVSIMIVNDEQIRQLNKQFLNRDCTTDCLSFDLNDGNELDSRRLFDIIVSGETAVRQAASRGHSAEAELALYITHGLLHNLGFDDSTPEKAKKMHNTEDKILQHFGYGLVYNSNKGL
jgi:probable rRNA maturation factor